MRVFSWLIVAIVFVSGAHAADKGSAKERLVECRGLTQAGQPFHAVFRLTPEYAEVQSATYCDSAGCLKGEKLPFKADGSSADETLYSAKRDRDGGTKKYPEKRSEIRALTLHKATGRFSLRTWTFRPNDLSKKQVEGDCKKFVPSDAFQ